MKNGNIKNKYLSGEIGKRGGLVQYDWCRVDFYIFYSRTETAITPTKQMFLMSTSGCNYRFESCLEYLNSPVA